MSRSLVGIRILLLAVLVMVSACGPARGAEDLPASLKAIAVQATAASNPGSAAGVYQKGWAGYLWLTGEGEGVLKDPGGCCSQGCYFPEPRRVAWRQVGDWIELEPLPCLDCRQVMAASETLRLLMIREQDRTLLAEESDIAEVANRFLAQEPPLHLAWARGAPVDPDFEGRDQRLPERLPVDLAAFMQGVAPKVEILETDDLEAKLNETGDEGYVLFSARVDAGSSAGVREGLVYHWIGPDGYVRAMEVTQVDIDSAILDANLSVFDAHDRSFMLRAGDRLVLSPPADARSRDARVQITGIAGAGAAAGNGYMYFRLSGRQVGGTPVQAGDWLQPESSDDELARVEAIGSGELELRYRTGDSGASSGPEGMPRRLPDARDLVGKELRAMTRLD